MTYRVKLEWDRYPSQVITIDDVNDESMAEDVALGIDGRFRINGCEYFPGLPKKATCLSQGF